MQINVRNQTEKGEEKKVRQLVQSTDDYIDKEHTTSKANIERSLQIVVREHNLQTNQSANEIRVCKSKINGERRRPAYWGRRSAEIVCGYGNGIRSFVRLVPMARRERERAALTVVMVREKFTEANESG